MTRFASTGHAAVVAPRPPTPDQAAEQLEQLAHIIDEENIHHRADQQLVTLLRQLGYGAAADAFEALPRWYS